MDWQNLIKSLVESGLTQIEIAEATGSTQATISDIQRGITKDPRSSIGLSLLAIAKRRGISVPGANKFQIRKAA